MCENCAKTEENSTDGTGWSPELPKPYVFGLVHAQCGYIPISSVPNNTKMYEHVHREMFIEHAKLKDPHG